MPITQTTHRTLSAARGMILAGLVATVSVVGGTAAMAATTTKLDFNISVNPGAEAANGGTGGVVPIPLWSRTSTMTAVKYGTPGFPSLEDAASISGGKNAFFCGLGTAGSLARQRIAIVGRNKAIDAGNIKLTATIRMGTNANDGDNGRMTVRYLDVNGKTIGTLVIGPFANTSGAMPRTIKVGSVPPKTRALRVVLDGRTVTGPDCNVLFDNVSVRLSKVS